MVLVTINVELKRFWGYATVNKMKLLDPLVSKSLLIAFLFILLLEGAQQSALTSTLAAPVGTIWLALDCRSRPERTTLTNNTTEGLALTGWTLSSLVRPRGNEPFALSGRLEAGASITYFTGPDAIPGRTTLAEYNIYDKDDPLEGARLETPFGAIEVRCLSGFGTLQVGPPSLGTTTATGPSPGSMQSTLINTGAPASASPSGPAQWLDRPPGTAAVTLVCPGSGQWLLLYWGSGDTVPIATAAAICANADRYWTNREGRWLGFSKDTPSASDVWNVTWGEAHFVHGR